MGKSASNVDRLLPRHDPRTGLDLAWNVRSERHGFRKEEVSDVAVIRDISLEGALVEVDESHVHEVNDRIAVRFRGMDGKAVIRHRRETEGETRLYGVRFLPDPGFVESLGAAVGELRGHSSELDRAWHRRN